MIIWVIVTNCVCCDFDDCDFVGKGAAAVMCESGDQRVLYSSVPWISYPPPTFLVSSNNFERKIPILIILTCYQYQLPIYLAFSDVLKEVWYYIVCIFIHMIYCEVGSRRWFSQKEGLPACQRKKLKGWIRGAGHTWGRGRLNSKLHLLLAMPCQPPPSLLPPQLYLFCTPDHSPRLFAIRCPSYFGNFNLSTVTLVLFIWILAKMKSPLCWD